MNLRILLTLGLLAASAGAESLQWAKVTRVVNEVRIFPSSGSARSAQVGDVIRGATSIQTGRNSRAEIVFQDQTLTRLGQNSVFSFRTGSRDVELQKGSVLLQVPKSAGGASIRTATVTAAITGTTSMFEYNPGAWVKLITLEGTQQLTLGGSSAKSGGPDRAQVPPGEMLVMPPDGSRVPQAMVVDVAKLVRSSRLLDRRTFGDLPADALQRIRQTIDQQKEAKRSGTLLPTNSVVSGPGIRSTRSSRSLRTSAREIGEIGKRNPEYPEFPEYPDFPTNPEGPSEPEFPGSIGQPDT